MELLRRIFAEVVPLDIKLTAERHLAAAFHAAVLTERHVEPFHLPFRIVLDDDLDRIEYGHRARSNRVQVFAHAELEQAVFHQIFRAGHADARTEVTDGFRGPVRGFAVTLSLGIVASMFTAIFVSRTAFGLWLGGNDGKKLSI